MLKKAKQLKKVVSYAGPKSQTGLAAAIRFPDLSLDGSNESFADIAEMLLKSEILAILPVWNSHEGEIPKTELLNSIFDKNLKVQEVWPKRIKFECHAKKGVKLNNIKNIISVKVAENQCSDFIQRLKSKGASFHERPSTKKALEDFQSGSNFDAILNAPGQCNNLGYTKLKDDVSNDVNFTTFTLTGNLGEKSWVGKRWKSLRDHGLPKENVIFGIEMDVPTTGFSESQHSLFEQLTQDISDLDKITKAIFVVKREGGRCGVIFESSMDSQTHENVSMEPDDEGQMPNITIKKDLGSTNKEYVSNCLSLFKKEFFSVLKHDFIKHKGTNACFYGCPALNILTHGFDEVVVEEVVRKIIDLSFKLLDNGISCTNSQRAFFKKYKNKYYKQGAGFIQFRAV